MHAKLATLSTRTHLGLDWKADKELRISLLCKNVGFRVGNFERKVWAFREPLCNSAHSV